ncbi:oligosaccharyl transferase delta subunit [Artomyces pyxidatus]|uniref:Oligosaccharyl transferase delta subunit n=1 Tax=Artomyces pyxidatus TaxID=48021 RepID=A0ACB8T6D5_9AGAM|nr:oligosaccharyl transferase delta subunit [Artomyces pyxidatus]
MGVLSFLLLPLVAAAAVNAGQLTVQSPRFTVLSSDGSQLRSEKISLSNISPEPVSLGASDTLKLTFQVTDKEGGDGVQPHQTFLRFYDETTGEEGIQPVKVTPAGKAKFDLNMARPPSSLPPSGEAPLKVSLILGSYVHKPAKVDLFDLVVPASLPAPQHPDEHTFHPLPVISHTFRPEQKVPPRFVSAVSTAAVLAPWVVLLGLWGTVGAGVPRLFSPSIFPFTLSLGVIEALLLWYWVELRLGQILLYGSGAAFLSAVAGKQALASIGAHRLSRK